MVEQPNCSFAGGGAEMSVPACHGQIRVPHQLLNGLRTCPTHGQMSPERVAQAVDATSGEGGEALHPLNQNANTLLRERGSVVQAQDSAR